MHATVLIVALLGLSAVCSGQASSTYSAGCGLGARWEETENGWSGTWTRRGNSNTFDAAWRNSGSTGSSVLTMTMTGNRVHIERRDAASFNNGLQVAYDVVIAADGTVSGPGRILPSGPSFPMSATVVCGGTSTGVVPPPSVTAGAHYRVENLVYGAPDLYLNPRNYHDFIVDFAKCSIRELNQQSDQGLEQIRVSVCRANTRLQFTTVWPNSTLVEYDWVFLDGGKTIAGAYRQGSTFGPSVGGKCNP